MKLGEAVFALNGSTPELPKGHFVHWALGVRFEDIDGWLEKFKQEGVEYFGPFGHGGVGLISIYFRDSTGYLIEFSMDAGDWETAKAEGKKCGGLFGNTQATYDPDDWDFENEK